MDRWPLGNLLWLVWYVNFNVAQYLRLFAYPNVASCRPYRINETGASGARTSNRLRQRTYCIRQVYLKEWSTTNGTHTGTWIAGFAGFNVAWVAAK